MLVEEDFLGIRDIELKRELKKDFLCIILVGLYIKDFFLVFF
ncbi:hypothetical protein GCM10010095_85100 [Streptomyces anthocyanicus]|nr:hypothetical protein GCM10010095_85100 [Streptomyces anthocyanicus]